MAEVLNCDFEINKFEPQPRCYFYFRTNAIWKGMNPPPNTPSYGLNSITAVFF